MLDFLRRRLDRAGSSGLHFDLLLGLGMRGAGAVSAFAMTLVIARGFGPATFGQFQLAVATVSVLALVALQGHDRLIIRTASPAFANNDPGKALDLFRAATRRQLLVGVPLVIALIILAEPVGVHVLGETKIANHLQILAPAIVGLAIIRSASALLRAKASVLISQSLDGVAYTTLAVAAIGVLFLCGFAISPFTPSIVYLASILVVAAAGLWLTRRALRGVVRKPAQVSLASGLFIAGFNVLSAFSDWIGLFLLTAYTDSTEAGIYRAGFQICMLFTLVNASFSMMAGPRLAKSYAAADAASMKQALRSTSLLGTAIVMPLFLAIILGAEPILSLFGEAFVEGANALRVLAVGQLINVAAGPAGAALTMMHRERKVLLIEIAAVLASVGLLVWLLPLYGIMAAALAAASAAAIRNGAALVVLYHAIAKLGPTAAPPSAR